MTSASALRADAEETRYLIRQRKQTACWQLCCSTPITGGVDPRHAFQSRILPSKPIRPLFSILDYAGSGASVKCLTETGIQAETGTGAKAGEEKNVG